MQRLRHLSVSHVGPVLYQARSKHLAAMALRCGDIWESNSLGLKQSEPTNAQGEMGTPEAGG